MKQGLQGVVFGIDGIGLAEVAVMVFAREGMGKPRLMALGITNPNGEYHLRFSEQGAGGAYCCFFKDGYELAFRELDEIGSKGTVGVDAILHHAVSMSFRIKNRLGFSLPGLGVRITADGDHAYPVSYATDRNGFVQTQSILREDGRYRLAVLSGSIELHVETFLVRDSDALEIIVPLAHVQNPLHSKAGSNRAEGFDAL